MATKVGFKSVVFFLAMISAQSSCFSTTNVAKEHDFLPRVNNLIFVFDTSVSMRSQYYRDPYFSRLAMAAKALKLFNLVMPPVPRWQYDVNTALLTFGDCPKPTILSPVSSWTSERYFPYLGILVSERPVTRQTATLEDALLLSGQLMGTAQGRTAIVIFGDGGTGTQCPQQAALALKQHYGNNPAIFGIFFGDSEIGWRNLYEVCKLTGGYARTWEEVDDKNKMKRFAWDIFVREVMFPYTEIFFQEHSSDLIPSEGLKLENVAAFLHSIPQYVLQIDGHTTVSGRHADNYRLGMERARSVKNCLVKLYKIPPTRILIRSWGEEFPRYDNGNPDLRLRNSETDLYLVLPLKNFPYDEKHLHTFETRAIGEIYNNVERNSEAEWAQPRRSFQRSGPVLQMAQ